MGNNPTRGLCRRGSFFWKAFNYPTGMRTVRGIVHPPKDVNDPRSMYDIKIFQTCLFNLLGSEVYSLLYEELWIDIAIFD